MLTFRFRIDPAPDLSLEPRRDTSLDCEEAEEANPSVALSESFTIHLGSQLGSSFIRLTDS